MLILFRKTKEIKMNYLILISPFEHRFKSHIQLSCSVLIDVKEIKLFPISFFSTLKIFGWVPYVNDDASLLDIYSTDVKSIWYWTRFLSK